MILINRGHCIVMGKEVSFETRTDDWVPHFSLDLLDSFSFVMLLIVCGTWIYIL